MAADMRIGVNTTGLGPGYGGEEELYVRTLLTRMAELQPRTSFVCFTDPHNHGSFAPWECVEVPPEKTGLFRRRSGGAAANLAAALGRIRVDALYSSLLTAPARCPVPVVLYVADPVATADRATSLGRRGAARLKELKQICAQAHGMLAPTPSAQRTLMEVFEIPLNKVAVVPPGVDPIFEQPQAGIVQKPYFLTVGRTASAENVARLRQVASRLREQMGLTMAVVGAVGEAEPEDWGDGVLRFENVPPRQLAGLYQHAAFVFCPPFFQGTPMTVLKAMRAGARLVAVRVPAITELAGSRPLYFDPARDRSMMDAIARALNETPKEREEAVKSGVARAAEFTWDKCALRTLKVFSSIR